MCYAGQVGAMWSMLGESMDHVASTGAIADGIIVAVLDAFLALQRSRTHDPSGISVRAAVEPRCTFGRMSEDARAKLDPLRTELGQIDREILALVARRQAVAQR